MSPETASVVQVSSAEGPVRRTIRLMTAIADAGGPVTIQSLAQRLELPPSTVHRLLQVLRDEGLVERHSRRAEYRIGPGWYRMAARVVEGMDAVQLARPVVRRVGETAGEACLFGLYLAREHALTFVVRHRSPHPLGYRVTMNEPLALAWGASGKAILAHLPDPTIAEVLAGLGPSPAAGVDAEPNALQEELTRLRSEPYVISHGERLPGAVGIAAPVFDAGARVVGSICLTIPEARFDRDKTGSLGELVRREADALSAALGAPTDA
jgi:DNA-binding IclR family transcriptional regulator